MNEDQEVIEEQEAEALQNGEDFSDEPDFTEGVDGEDGQTWDELSKPLGWRTIEHFNGNPADFVDAETFYKKGQASLPILRDNIKTVTRKLESMERKLSVQDSTYKMNMAAQKKRMEIEHEAKMREAVQEGDTQAYDAAKQARDTEMAAYDEPQPQEDTAAALADFENRNPWFGKNQVASDFADAESGRLRTRFPNLTIEENLERVEDAVKQNFPEEFGNPKRGRRSAVAPGRRAPPKKGGKTFEGMPAESRDACEEAVRAGFVKDKKTFVENFYLLQEKET